MSLYAAQVINSIPGIEGKTYLELGLDDKVRTFATFEKVKAQMKYGVDIAERQFQTHHMSTDEFFAEHAWECGPFDVVFIDADHHHEPVIRDYNNATLHLAPGGIILAHDLVPKDHNFTKRDSCSTGFYLLAALVNRGDEHWTLDTDMGLTLFPSPRAIDPASVVEMEYDAFIELMGDKRMSPDTMLEKVRERWPTAP